MATTSYVKPAIFAGVALVGLLFVWKGVAKASPPAVPKPQCGPGEVYDATLKKCVKTATPPPPVDTTCVDCIRVAEFDNVETPAQRADLIRWAQERMVIAGALASEYGAVDGKCGPKTLAAINKFQSMKGLAATGCINADTWNALQAVGPGQANVLGEEIIDANGYAWRTVKEGSRWKATCKEPGDYQATFGGGVPVVYGTPGGDFGTVISAVNEYAFAHPIEGGGGWS